MSGSSPSYAAIIAVILLAGCGNGEAAPAAADGRAPVVLGPEAVMVVDSALVETGPAVSGDLAPERAAAIVAQVSGTVVELLVEQGQAVASGQLLLRLDATAIEDAFRSAQSGARSAEQSAVLARRDAERAERLASAGAIAERDLEVARWNVMTADASAADARARLAAAQKQLGQTAIRAPFRGVVSERPVGLGDVVQPGHPLVTVVDPTRLRLEASVPADRIQGLRVGARVRFTVSGQRGRIFGGRIERINPVVDPATRQVRVYVEVPNPERTLVGGLFAEGRVALESRRGLAVPLAALDPRGTTPTVARLRGGVVEEVPVRLGLRDEIAERVEVLDGVAAGDTVLVGQALGVAVGARVRVGRE